MEFESDEESSNAQYGRSWQEGLHTLHRSHPVLPLSLLGIKRDPYAVFLTCYVLILTACGFLKISVTFAPYIVFLSILVFIPYLFAHVLYACGFVLYRIVDLTVRGLFFLVRGFCVMLVLLFLPSRRRNFIYAKISNSKLYKKSSQVFSEEDDELANEGAEGAPKKAECTYAFYSSDESDY